MSVRVWCVGSPSFDEIPPAGDVRRAIVRTGELLERVSGARIDARELSCKGAAEAMRAESAGNSRPHLVVLAVAGAGAIPEGCFPPADGEFPLFVAIDGRGGGDELLHALSRGVADVFVAPLDIELFAAKAVRALKPASLGLRLDRFGMGAVYTRKGGGRVALTPKEYLLLGLLQERFPGGATRVEALALLWPAERVVPKVFDVHLFKLRRKLEPFGLEIRYDAGCYFLVAPAR